MNLLKYLRRYLKISEILTMSKVMGREKMSIVNRRKAIFKKYRRSISLYKKTGGTIINLCRKVIYTVDKREKRRREKERRRIQRQREVDAELRRVISEIQEVLGERAKEMRTIEESEEGKITVSVHREQLEEETMEEEEERMENREDQVETIDLVLKTQERTLGELQIIEENMRALIEVLCEEAEMDAEEEES